MQLVVRLQPDEAIYLKMIVKRPGGCTGLCCACWACSGLPAGALLFAACGLPLSLSAVLWDLGPQLFCRVMQICQPQSRGQAPLSARQAH